MAEPGKTRVTPRGLTFFALFLGPAVLAQGTGVHTPFDTGSENQLGLTFSPNGKTAFWVAWDGKWGSTGSRRVIYMARQHNGTWSRPAPAPFSGSYSDDDPFVSPDGRWLYFVSERPAYSDDRELDADIWRYGLLGDRRLERLSVNSDAAEYSPVVTAGGAIYFASVRTGGPGQGDLYRAAPADGEFLAPEALGPAVNSQTGEWNLWVAADESEMIFEASSRPSNVSTPGDLYYSWQTTAGWTAAIPIEALNTAGSDLMPRLHPDGETLYYTTAPIGGHAHIARTDWKPLRSQLRDSYAPTLLVANRTSHEIRFVNLADGEVADHIATGETRIVELAAGSEGALAIEGRIWVANATEGSISVVDPHSGKVSAHINSACGFPIALTQDNNRRVWVACFASAELLSIDPDEFSVLRRISLDHQPLNVLAHPDRPLAYVSLPRRNAVAEIDLTSGAALRQISVGIEPDGLRWLRVER